MVENAPCKNNRCFSIVQQSRRRDTTKNYQSTENIVKDVLLTYLNSLHVYLLHDGKELFRIRKENEGDVVDDSHFTTAGKTVQSLRFSDGIDAFIEFVRSNNDHASFVVHLKNWLKNEEYDSDSLLNDINCKIDGCGKQVQQSNLYLFLTDYRNEDLFEFVYEKYIDNTEIDQFIQFVREKSDDNEFVTFFTIWLVFEAYDIDSILSDINCEIDGKKQSKQSNIYSFFNDHRNKELFDIIYEQYVDNSTINAINFGVSVLRWFGYKFKSKYKSLADEVLNNQFSEIPKDQFEMYKEQCSILLESGGTNYKYTFDELLSLKVYTDESEFTSMFRKSFWSNCKKEMRQEFFWWSSTIYKTTLYHSEPIPQFDSTSASPGTLYHGINTIFAVSARAPKYHGPVSTTLTMNVAEQFSDNKGLVWFIRTSYYNPFNFMIGVDVSLISKFKNETEILLNDQHL
eukprot:102552_1